MKPKDLLDDLEKGDRTKEHLTISATVEDINAPFNNPFNEGTLNGYVNSQQQMQNTINQLYGMGLAQSFPIHGLLGGLYGNR